MLRICIVVSSLIVCRVLISPVHPSTIDRQHLCRDVVGGVRYVNGDPITCPSFLRRRLQNRVQHTCVVTLNTTPSEPHYIRTTVGI